MMLQNLRCAIRQLRAAPGFTATAILSLGVGIGGTVSMFTLVHSVVLKPLAYRDPDRLVLITQNSAYQSVNHPSFGIAPLEFLRWRETIQLFDSVALLRGTNVNITGPGSPETLGAARVSAEFFDTLGVNPQMGRWFRRNEERAGAPNVAILSAALWRRRFSADPNVIGNRVILDGAPHEIVGVTGPDLRFFRGRQLHEENDFADRTDIFLPVRFTEAEQQGRFNIVYLAVARLKGGVLPEQVKRELDASLPALRPDLTVGPDFRWWTVVQPLQTALTGDTSQTLWLLLCAVGFVLLIACTNLANLGVIRTLQRSREFAIRVALGGTKRDLLGCSLSESLILAIAGTAVGLFLAVWIRDAIIGLAPSRIPRLDETSLDGSVIAFAVLVCALTLFLSGLLPAWRASQSRPQTAMSAAGRGGTETRQSAHLRGVLVGFEAAIGTALAVGAGLFLISLHKTLNVPRGYVSGGVLVCDFRLPPGKYATATAIERFFDGVRDQVGTNPGVAGVAATTLLPLDSERFAPIVAEHPNSSESQALVTWPAVTAGYFETMGIPLRAGRFFREGENDDVVVVSESAARALWPGEDPIGRKVSRAENIKSWLRVVGVVADVLSAGLDRPTTPTVYRPYSRYAAGLFHLLVRTTGPDKVDEPLRRAVARVDGEVPVPPIRAFSDLVGKSAQQRRFQTSLLTAFACLAIGLAAIGVYGVAGYSVLQRKREIGVRIALGADPGEVARMVFRSAMFPVSAGVAGGLALASVLATAIDAFLYGTSAYDPVAFVASPVVLAVAAAAPCWIAARRAVRIDPSICLRLE